MNEKWIGKKNDTSGSFFTTACSELQKRYGGKIDAIPLYKFNSRFGEEYFITDTEVIGTIEDLLADYESDSTAMYEFLYGLVIEEFGMIDFLVRIGHKIAEQRDQGYRKGKEAKQLEIQQVLGL